MRTAFWLAWRELVERHTAFAVGIAMVSVTVGLSTATDRVLQSRDAAVDNELGHIGPSIRVFVTRTGPAHMEPMLIPPAKASAIAKELSGELRWLGRRVKHTGSLDGNATLVIGVEPPHPAAALRAGVVSIGSELARTSSSSVGSMLKLDGQTVRVGQILDFTGTADDVAVVRPLSQPSNWNGLGGFEELHLYPKPGVDADALATRIHELEPGLTVARGERGSRVENEMTQGLARERKTVYALTALVVALCMLVWAHLNASERRHELAVLSAIGTRASSLAMMLALRAGLIGVLGGLVGVLFGTAAAVFQTSRDWPALAPFWTSAFVVCATVLASVAGAVPAAVLSTMRARTPPSSAAS
jgi:ABC-type lipoprotein release transport system permease subunit